MKLSLWRTMIICWLPANAGEQQDTQLQILRWRRTTTIISICFFTFAFDFTGKKGNDLDFIVAFYCYTNVVPRLLLLLLLLLFSDDVELFWCDFSLFHKAKNLLLIFCRVDCCCCCCCCYYIYVLLWFSFMANYKFWIYARAIKSKEFSDNSMIIPMGIGRMQITHKRTRGGKGHQMPGD